MGLDTVEISLRAEKLFAIEIQDEEAARVETVGQFYDLICSNLNIVPLSAAHNNLRIAFGPIRRF
jgi:hypothetical protein